MKTLSLFMVLVMLVMSFTAMAEPSSTESAGIRSLRPYIDGSVFIELDAVILCNTTVFMIDGTQVEKDIMYASVLSAFMGNKQIRVEALTATGCTGWGTQLQSIYMDAN